MQLQVVDRDDVEITPGTCLVTPLLESRSVEPSKLIITNDAVSLAVLTDQKRITPTTHYFLATPASAYAGILTLGLGDEDDLGAEDVRRAGGKAVEALRSHRIDTLVVDFLGLPNAPIEAFLEGVIIGQYDFTQYKEEPDELPTYIERIIVVSEAIDAGLRERCEHSVLTSLNTNWARDLANLAPNHLVPSSLAAYAEAIARELDCKSTVMGVDELRRLGMNAILSVSRGSSTYPKLIILEYSHPEATKTVALVGKGVTFDTGGISLKPGLNMHEMKYDMCGAAAVLGAFKTIATVKPKINVKCLVPASENKTGADAQRPGDIVRAYNGKTIEVHNTDAEGRLLLADALAYASEKFSPDAMIDCATLTGAVIAALGHFGAGIMSNDDNVQAQLQAAAESTGERVWPLPMWDDYAETIKGTHADLCNMGPPGQAGSIAAACFLENFVGNTPWAHIDIAGTAWGVDGIPYLNPKHATGYGVRLLTQWVLDYATA